jgi:hypothetical protein
VHGNQDSVGKTWFSLLAVHRAFGYRVSAPACISVGYANGNGNVP